jgi:hypothetical protein
MAATEDFTVQQLTDIKVAAERILGTKCKVRSVVSRLYGDFEPGVVEIHTKDDQEG